MVSSYLVHHGYSGTAEKFADITGQRFTEDITSIKTRQSKSVVIIIVILQFNVLMLFPLEILKLVQLGRIGQAISETSRAYPGLLESNQNLLFMLKCRQFVEMVNGSDLDVIVNVFATLSLPSLLIINHFITDTIFSPGICYSIDKALSAIANGTKRARF